MFSSYFFVVWLKSSAIWKASLFSSVWTTKQKRKWLVFPGLPHRGAQGDFQNDSLSLHADIRLAMESYKPNAWFPTSLKFSYCKRNLFEWVWLLVVIVSSTQCHITRTGVSVRDYLDSVGLWAGWGREGYHLDETEERRPDHYGNCIPYAGDSVAAEGRLSAGIHVQICSSLPLTVCAVWVTVPPSVPWFPHNDGL